MRNLRKVFRAKRAFSAVIASLIMMLLAVAAGVVVYAYVMGWIGGTTQNPQRTGQMQFDSIYASAGTGKIKMYVRNVGGADLNLSKIYISGVDTANSTGTLEGYSFGVQAVAYLEANCTMTKNYFYEVIVTCKDGTSVSQSVQAK
jgi:FlaG/FlaF family flagellin (archaellin)